jgi:hypothetical protein
MADGRRLPRPGSGEDNLSAVLIRELEKLQQVSLWVLERSDPPVHLPLWL